MVKDEIGWERITNAFKNGCVVIKKEQKGINISNERQYKRTEKERTKEI